MANLLVKNDYVKLHLSLVLAGFTGIFGKLINLNEGLLVFYRVLISFVLLYVLLLAVNKIPRVNKKDFFKICGVGVLLALHFLFFYGSIKYSNVSIGVVCYSLVGFFTAIFEPIIVKRKFCKKEIMYSLMAVAGILLIFNLDPSHRFGIILGVIASAIGALYTIANKIVEPGKSSMTMLFYEFLGGAAFMTAIIPVYLIFNPVVSVLPTMMDLGYLIVLAFFCTIGQYVLLIQALKTLSAFTVSLSGNMEPLYGIVIAMIFLGEAQQLSIPFYIGMSIIVLSVFMQSLSSKKPALQRVEI